jgi:hypothetical protein
MIDKIDTETLDRRDRSNPMIEIINEETIGTIRDGTIGIIRDREMQVKRYFSPRRETQTIEDNSNNQNVDSLRF